MKLTLNSGMLNPAFGFGNASFHIFMSLTKLGYDVKHNDFSRDFQISFTSPQDLHSLISVRAKYKIGYFAWESSKSVSGRMHHQVDFFDEIWVPNKCNAEYAREWGRTGIVRIYPHGINPEYHPEALKKPLPSNRLEVVNVGFPAIRKQAKELVEAWADSEYSKRDDAMLTIKTYASAEDRAKELFAGIPNVNIVAKDFTVQENIKFLNNFNLHLYPSYGEGFGLSPLETMALGIPTVVMKDGWCDYSYIQEDLTVPYTVGPAPDAIGAKYHPGDVFNVDLNDMMAKVDEFSSDIPGYLSYARERAPLAVQDYNWMNLTREHFSAYDAVLDRLR